MGVEECKWGEGYEKMKWGEGLEARCAEEMVKGGSGIAEGQCRQGD